MPALHFGFRAKLRIMKKTAPRTLSGAARKPVESRALKSKPSVENLHSCRYRRAAQPEIVPREPRLSALSRNAIAAPRTSKLSQGGRSMAKLLFDHFIVLMLENRSFDHLFGYLGVGDGVPRGGGRNYLKPDDQSTEKFSSRK